MKNWAIYSPLSPPQATKVKSDYYSVNGLDPRLQLSSWSECVGGVLELIPTYNQIGKPFRASVTRYTVGEFSFSDIYSDSIRVERSLAKISIDRPCNFFLFGVCVEGDSHSLEGRFANRRAPVKSKILAIDLDQPIKMLAHQHRFSSFYVPRAFMESIIPNSDALHGRSVDDSTPLARLLINHTTMLNANIGGMSFYDAGIAVRNAVHLIAALFGKQVRLSGHARAAARAIMFSQVRNFIRKHLDDSTMSAEKILLELQLPRDTLYRMFEHEGGIAAFICDCRIRAAAEDIVTCPQIPLKDIAYGVGFNSASAFSRTFKREQGISPQDLREYVLSNYN